MSIKLCECKCGKPAPIAAKTDTSRGYIKGQPTRFIQGHDNRINVQKGNLKHGHRRIISTPTYKSWCAMCHRCNNPNDSFYHRYGGRGIQVCNRWNDFKNFLADMGERPDGKTLDRIDNDGNYEPGNCRWATPKEQAQNRPKKLKEFCYKGHPYSGDNLYINSRGDRCCRECSRLNARASRARIKMAS